MIGAPDMLLWLSALLVVAWAIIVDDSDWPGPPGAT